MMMREKIRPMSEKLLWMSAAVLTSTAVASTTSAPTAAAPTAEAPAAAAPTTTASISVASCEPLCPREVQLSRDELEHVLHHLDHETDRAPGVHARAACREWRSAYDATHDHLFVIGMAGRFHLPPFDCSFERYKLHEKAARLVFVHESEGEGEQRHLVLKHPRSEADRQAARARPPGRYPSYWFPSCSSPAYPPSSPTLS